MTSSKYVNPCPICGDRKIRITRTIIPRMLKKWGLDCQYCGFGVGYYLTKHGAIRVWNRKTNIRSVADEQEVGVNAV